MKKVILIIYFLAVLFIPTQVFASGGVEVDTTSITVEQGSSTTFNITATNAASQLTFSTSDSKIATIENKPDWIENETKAIKVNGLSVGTSTISIKVNAATFDEEVIQKTVKIKVKVIPPKSSNTNLSSIKINGVELSNFDPNKTSYTLKSTEASSIKVTASASDSKATIVGTGTKSLSYGVNTINIVVTAENGNKKTYTLKITRNDNRSSENSLLDLSINPGNIEFDSNKTDYTIVVDNNVTQMEVVAKAKDSKAKVTGTGLIDLTDDINEINIVVTAENGSRKTYTIKVIKNNEIENLSSNNKLKQLIVHGYNINFESGKDIYYLEVSKNVDKINMEAISEDEKATVLINNLDTLEVGENIITIDVTAENGDIKTYKIIVNKNDNEVLAVHSCIYKNIVIIEAVIIIVLVALIIVLLLKKKKKIEEEM